MPTGCSGGFFFCPCLTRSAVDPAFQALFVGAAVPIPTIGPAGISDAEIGEQFDNLATFIVGQIEEAVDKLSAKDDSLRGHPPPGRRSG